MDAASAGAIATAVSAAAASAGTEAGRHAWESLLDLCRRIGRGRPGSEIAVPDDAGDEEQIRLLTASVIDESERDETFAADLERWAGQHGLSVRIDRGDVHNTISGDARISGPVIQGRDFSGPISFGN